MSVNSTISCNWASAVAVVGDIQTDKLNVTDIVGQCSNVCQIVFESRKPDIAGEGIMISYMIQVALVSLLGTLFPAFIYILNACSSKPISPITPLLRILQASLFSTNALLTISLTIACIVIYHQQSTVLELCFLSSLANLQYMVTTNMLFGQLADKVMNTQNLPGMWLLYYCVIYVAQIAVTSIMKLPHKTIYTNLARECHSQHEYLDVSSATSHYRNSEGTTTLSSFGVSMLIVLGMTITIPFLALAWKRVRDRVPGWIRKYTHVVLLFLLLSFCVFAIVLNAITTDIVRRLVKKTSAGGEEVGYGQTTALVLWVPFFWEAMKETIKYWRSTPVVERAEEEMRELGQGPPPPVGADIVPPPYSPHKGLSLPENGLQVS